MSGVYSTLRGEKQVLGSAIPAGSWQCSGLGWRTNPRGCRLGWGGRQVGLDPQGRNKSLIQIPLLCPESKATRTGRVDEGIKE